MARLNIRARVQKHYTPISLVSTLIMRISVCVENHVLSWNLRDYIGICIVTIVAYPCLQSTQSCAFIFNDYDQTLNRKFMCGQGAFGPANCHVQLVIKKCFRSFTSLENCRLPLPLMLNSTETRYYSASALYRTIVFSNTNKCRLRPSTSLIFKH